MPRATPENTTKRPRARRVNPTPPPPSVPAQPPQTAAEIRGNAEIVEMLQSMTRGLHQQNLQSAVWLAMDALQNGGELDAHFAELGRRFGDRVPAAVRQRLAKHPVLRVISGGAA